MSSTVPSVLNEKERRYTALDGLRGTAALAVFFFHLFLFAQPYLPPVNIIVAIYDSPLGIVFAGHEAVAVFFVLSGFVICLPVLRQGKKFNWVKYYVSRMIRLYVPSAIAVLLSGALLATVMSKSTAPWQDNNWIFKGTIHSFTVWNVLQNGVLFVVDGSTFNNVLWSLKWEIYFSLLLPVFVAFAYLTRKFWYLAVLICVGGIIEGVISQADEPVMQIYATFGFGALLAVHHKKLQDMFNKILVDKLLSTLVTAFIVFAAFAALTVEHSRSNLFTVTLYPLGAVLIVIAALYLPLVIRFLQKSLIQFLGKISFSLYLVHVPIIVTLGYVFGPSNWFFTILAALPLAFIVALLFQRYIEAPSHVFAKFSGRQVSTLVESRVLHRS